MIDTKSFVMSTKKPRPWRKMTFDMLPISLGGIRLKLQAMVVFVWSYKQGCYSQAQQLTWLLAFLCAIMGRLHVGCKFFQIILFKFYFPSFLLEF
jgi:hypothetical protein